MNKLSKYFLLALMFLFISWQTSTRNLTTIKRQIIDECVEPLIGVSIFAECKGTITDLNGNFTL
jgi:hypothetical protein